LREGREAAPCRARPLPSKEAPLCIIEEREREREVGREGGRERNLDLGDGDGGRALRGGCV